MIPVRCFTCNKVIGNKWEKYEKLLEDGNSAKDTFKKLGLKRSCCKRMFLTNVDITDKLMEYNDISFPNIEYKQEQARRTYGTF
jgi:DNA-directed RNA polymerases I, II, and III subunit RPABC5